METIVNSGIDTRGLLCSLRSPWRVDEFSDSSSQLLDPENTVRKCALIGCPGSKKLDGQAEPGAHLSSCLVFYPESNFEVGQHLLYQWRQTLKAFCDTNSPLLHACHRFITIALHLLLRKPAVSQIACMAHRSIGKCTKKVIFSAVFILEHLNSAPNFSWTPHNYEMTLTTTLA